MRVEPVSPEVVVERLVDRVLDGLAAAPAAEGADRRWRVLLDGAPPTAPGVLADALAEPLRARGHAALRVSAGDFLRPAGVRFEHGRQDPDALLDDALDAGALIREVLDPLGPGGDGTYLPALWDAARERSARATRVAAPPGAVLLLDGHLLLGRWLPADLTVHLAVRPATLARLTPPAEAWRLAAEERYRDEAAPEEAADVVVRVDDPRRPGWVLER
ncbi:uridine kinase [Cellulomonas pakistanensis]|uniref:Uridine kinase n=1 Tax=Cellulomonas pakistanensis TaxID=992287 RepID=A0A919PBH3_9CELL|nr:uridine kinase [Cellulomonas pakistanensis]GIG35572.1 uridine kinase [Cellulomonas pakistanensis]